MKTFSKIFTIFSIALLFSSCEENEVVSADSIPFSTVAFSQNEFFAEIESATPVYKIEVNMTDVSDVDRVFTVKQIPFVELAVTSGKGRPDLVPAADGDFTFDNKITVPAGSYKGYGNVTFNPAALTLGVERAVAFELVMDDANTKVRLPRYQSILRFTKACDFTKGTVSIAFDTYRAETSWEIYDASGILVASDGGFTAATPNPYTSKSFCLQDGNYTFVIYDTEGDGICCAWGNGSYTLTIDGATVATGGEFGSQDIVEFTVGN